MSEHSNLSRTQDNFASNLVNPRRSGMLHPEGTQGEEHYRRIYGSAKGKGQPEQYEDMSDLNGGPPGQDWDRQSHRSGRSAMSQFSHVNQRKVKGLETIYLQRLEPAAKGKTRKAVPGGSDKAKFRIMHHKYHDEPEWHVDDRDELDSIISGNYKEMQKKFEEEFQGSSQGTRSKKKKIVQTSGSNLFSGHMKQYKK